mmetsp:Transcript_9816/g.29349  ORF Transcript_9816/g.29349 Transcript_9816/m.29349 type:complete len:173 (+) Transcript_9816:383-901(+)
MSISAERQQQGILEVREAIHDRLGGGHHRDAVARALPAHVDATFLRDAALALESLLAPGNEQRLKPFYDALTADERKDVDFVRRTRALQAKKSAAPKIVERARALWLAFAGRCAYTVCHREVEELRNPEARALWAEYTHLVVEDEKRASVAASFCPSRPRQAPSASFRLVET